VFGRAGSTRAGLACRCVVGSAIDLGRGQFDSRGPPGRLVVRFAHVSFLKQMRRKCFAQRMVPKSRYRFSEKIMLKQQANVD